MKNLGDRVFWLKGRFGIEFHARSVLTFRSGVGGLHVTLDELVPKREKTGIIMHCLSLDLEQALPIGYKGQVLSLSKSSIVYVRSSHRR